MWQVQVILPSQALLRCVLLECCRLPWFLRGPAGHVWVNESLLKEMSPKRRLCHLWDWFCWGFFLLFICWMYTSVPAFIQTKQFGSVNSEAYEAFLSICCHLAEVWWLVTCESQQKGVQMTATKGQAVSLKAVCFHYHFLGICTRVIQPIFHT